MDLTFFNASETGLDITVTERYGKATRIRPSLYLPPHKVDIIKVNPEYEYSIGINTRE